MAGLIKEQMAPAQQQEAPPQQQQAMAPQAEMPMGGEEMEEGDSPDPDTNPQFVTALKFAMQALYENGAADGVAESLRAARDPVEGLANTAYDITGVVDERTEGAVPDELFVLLAMRILEEVADIGAAAGIKYKPSDLAMALKQMILRFLGEQGMDTSQLQAAMDQVDPEEFNRMATEEA